MCEKEIVGNDSWLEVQSSPPSGPCTSAISIIQQARLDQLIRRELARPPALNWAGNVVTQSAWPTDFVSRLLDGLLMNILASGGNRLIAASRAAIPASIRSELHVQSFEQFFPLYLGHVQAM